MSEVRLAAPTDETFTRGKSGAVWGRIYFEIDSFHFFPNREWTDMVIAFATAWLRSLIELAEKQSVRESVRFYDGPFQVDLRLKDGGFAQLSLIYKEVEQSSVEVSIESLLKNAVLVADQLLSSCAERNWSNADTEALSTLQVRARQWPKSRS